jgi:hypothetical protein
MEVILTLHQFDVHHFDGFNCFSLSQVYLLFLLFFNQFFVKVTIDLLLEYIDQVVKLV